VPPPLYAFDPDVGRLAVTTPHYSTAIVPVNNGAFPYGGVDLARLFDGRQEVAGSIGGVPPASFGMVVRKPSGNTILATQRPLEPGRRRTSPLRLVQAPAGVNASPRAKPTRAFAGSFRTLEATGAVHRGSITARSTYRFASSKISATWSFRATHTARRTVQVLFPSWGGSLAHVWAVAPDGWTREILNYRSLAGVRWFYVQSENSGYAVIPHTNPVNVRARLDRPASQPSAPRPGPTLVLERPATTDRAIDIGADLIPAPSLEAARKRVARRLAARG
jgi:hypothetical protein